MKPGISDGRAPSIIFALKRVGVRFATNATHKKPAGPEGGDQFT
jgi:hypothetical protein